MGTIICPYVCNVKYELDKHFIEYALLNSVKRQINLFRKRFLDDCETFLDKTKIDPNRSLEILNSKNPSIKFTMETSDKNYRSQIFLLKETIANYGCAFILNQETLACVSFSCHAIRTIVRKIYHLPQHGELVTYQKISSRN